MAVHHILRVTYRRRHFSFEIRQQALFFFYFSLTCAADSRKQNVTLNALFDTKWTWCKDVSFEGFVQKKFTCPSKPQIPKRCFAQPVIAENKTHNDTLQMFKVKGQRFRSQRKVMYQQQKRFNTAIDRFSDFKFGMAS